MFKKWMALTLMPLFAATGHAQEADPLTLEQLRAKYSDEESKFLSADGLEIHYKDEGSGYPVLLLHASFMNLSAWDYLADALKSDYRVIRFDFPNAGLTSAETKEPEGGKFNLIERNVEVAELVVEELGLERFDLIATSSGGSVGFRYASYHPDQVNRLVLINSAGMPRTRQTDPNRDRADVAKWQAMTYRPREFWEYSVGRNFPSLDAPPDWIVDLSYDLNRRIIPEVRAQYYFETGDPEGILGEITAPTMIMWGMENPTVMHLEATVISHWMTSAPTLVKKYEGLGHYPYVEKPDVIIPDIQAFLAGDLDDQLRQTQRMAVPVEAD